MTIRGCGLIRTGRPEYRLPSNSPGSIGVVMSIGTSIRQEGQVATRELFLRSLEATYPSRRALPQPATITMPSCAV
jgi:hypothetical protein